MVELQGVDAGYGGSVVLHDFNLSLHAGEFAALVGDDCDGKSSVARPLAGLIEPRCDSAQLYDARLVAPGQAGNPWVRSLVRIEVK